MRLDDIQIQGRCIIGEACPAYLIAEMSANHGQSVQHAKDILYAAREAGADCIKLQTYTPDTITLDCRNDWFMIKEGPWAGENLYDLYAKAYTPWEWHADLKAEADSLGLDFLSTPFDPSAVDFLEQIGIDFYKVASFEIVDIPLLRHVASKRKPILLSTGMATQEEIAEAVQAIRAVSDGALCLLKCSSAYPALPSEMNLKTMRHLSETFGVWSGLSDHSMGSEAAVIAVAMGAKVIEKHFCLSRAHDSPDASFSLEPQEFKQMVIAVRETEKVMGRVTFELSENERKSRSFRKSLFVVQDIKQGELFTRDSIRAIRPGDGLHTRHLEDVIGKMASCDIMKGTPLCRGHMV